MSKTFSKCPGKELAACPTSQNFFPLTCPLVTNLKESTVTLAYQLYNFGASGHKFLKNLGNIKHQLIQATAKSILCAAFLSQGTTHGRQTQLSAEPSELWPTN